MSDATDDRNTIPLPTPNTWLTQQLPEHYSLDLETQSYQSLHNAGFFWGDDQIATYPSLTASPDMPTTNTLPYPPTQTHPLYHTHELPVGGHKFTTSDTSATTYQAHPGMRTLTPGNVAESGLDERPLQSPMFSQRNITGLRTAQSAVDMTNVAPSSWPHGSGSLPSEEMHRTENPVDESPSGSEAGDDSPGDVKLKVSREKNRIAAAKTRRKKKTKAKEIEEHAQQIEQTNVRLHQELRTLRDTFSTLRYCALSHDPTAGCTCVGIHQYNAHMAKEVAKEVAKKL